MAYTRRRARPSHYGILEANPSSRAQGAYLFLDEVQEAEHWQGFCQRLAEHERVTLVVTVSSSKLSSEQAFLCYELNEYTTSLKPDTTAVPKVYAEDPGLVYAVLRANQQDAGKRLETAVYLELRRRQSGKRTDSITSLTLPTSKTEYKKGGHPHMQTPTLSVLTAQPSTEGTLAHRCSRRPFRRARETGLPTISMDSNSGGLTRRPDMATRTGPKARRGL